MMKVSTVRRGIIKSVALAAGVWVVPGMARGEAGATLPAEPATQPALTVQPWSLEPVMVTAQKRPEEIQRVAESVTAITEEMIRDADIKNVLDASRYAPSVEVAHFSNRRLSFPYIRGVGSGENSPAVTTNLDGVPQL